MSKPTDREKEYISSMRVARMATVDGEGVPLVVPVCYAFSGKYLYTPIDKKPKKVSPKELKRIRNISENPNVSIVIDEYSDDWTKLSHVIIRGRAEIIEEGEEYRKALTMLCNKYSQYEVMNLSGLGLPVIKITAQKIKSWGDL